MTRIAVLLVAAMALPFAERASAQVEVVSPPPSAAEADAQLRRLEAQWGQAFVDRDSAALGPILHSGFVAVYPNRWYTRRDFMLDAARRPEAGDRRVMRSLPDPDIIVRVFGATAVVHGTAIQEIEEGPADGRRRAWMRTIYTETFIWEDGRWQCIVGHYSPTYAPIPGNE